MYSTDTYIHSRNLTKLAHFVNKSKRERLTQSHRRISVVVIYRRRCCYCTYLLTLQSICRLKFEMDENKIRKKQQKKIK